MAKTSVINKIKETSIKSIGGLKANFSLVYYDDTVKIKGNDTQKAMLLNHDDGNLYSVFGRVAKDVNVLFSQLNVPVIEIEFTIEQFNGDDILNLNNAWIEE